MSPDAMPTQANAEAQAPAPTPVPKPRLTGDALKAYLAGCEERRLAAKAHRLMVERTRRMARKAGGR